MVRERIARVRYERTMTMREPKDEKAQGFESLLTEEEKAGLSEEEKMKRIAAKMEEKFKSEQRRASTVIAVSRQRKRFGADMSRQNPSLFLPGHVKEVPLLTNVLCSAGRILRNRPFLSPTLINCRRAQKIVVEY